ncbi:reprolysin-like metallopeptidase [Streptomyces sp. NPDC056503]|uniref:InlB B-repeat-containing protein n=1 Tax=Streptomyces sp. NPDC056503 TaxID=3345842 RepID=UPI0036924862
MARYRWTGGAALGAMALGVTTVTGFAPPGTGDGSGATAHERAERAVVAAGAFSLDDGARVTNKGAGRPRTGPAGDDAAEAFGAEFVRGRIARVVPAALAPVCGTGYGREATFPLFGDVVVQAVEATRATVGSTLVWHGRVAGAVDQNVVLTLDGGCDRTPGNEILSGQFMLGGDLYAIRSAGPGRVLISQGTPLTDEDEPRPTEPPVAEPPATGPLVAGPPAAGPSAAGLTAALAAARADGTPATVPAKDTPTAKAVKATKAAAACKGGAGYALIDVLVGYTPGARTEAGGDAQGKALAAQGIALGNDAFSASGTKVRLRLVGTTPVSVPASLDGVTNNLLSAVALPTDGVADTLAAQRDQYAADLVSVLAAGRAAGGLGYTPPDPGPATAPWGYSVVGRAAVTNYSMGHEIGHNMSADHDRVTQPVQPDNGATGYFPAKGDWSTVMAYESSCRKATKGVCTRINRFANPRQTYRGERLGVPIGSADSADTADVLSTTGRAVAAYRAAKTSDALCAVTTSVTPQGAGTVSAAQPGPYPQGTQSTYTATAAKGYVFSGWKLDGKAATGGASGFRVPAGDHAVVAVFEKGTTPTSTVTTKTSGQGTVAKAPAKRAEREGADLLYEAVPAPGWDFAGWRLDGSHAGDDDSLALSVGQDDMELTALFEERRHELRVEQRGHGSVDLSQAGPYSDGDTVTATAVPAPGYVFTDWLLDGEPYGGDEEDARGETAVSFEETGHTLTALFTRAAGHPDAEPGHTSGSGYGADTDSDAEADAGTGTDSKARTSR